jgi:hypothetical protein
LKKINSKLKNGREWKSMEFFLEVRESGELVRVEPGKVRESEEKVRAKRPKVRTNQWKVLKFVTKRLF